MKRFWKNESVHVYALSKPWLLLVWGFKRFIAAVLEDCSNQKAVNWIFAQKVNANARNHKRLFPFFSPRGMLKFVGTYKTAQCTIFLGRVACKLEKAVLSYHQKEKNSQGKGGKPARRRTVGLRLLANGGIIFLQLRSRERPAPSLLLLQNLR